jgi:hypothetical protein
MAQAALGMNQIQTFHSSFLSLTLVKVKTKKSQIIIFCSWVYPLVRDWPIILAISLLTLHIMETMDNFLKGTKDFIILTMECQCFVKNWVSPNQYKSTTHGNSKFASHSCKAKIKCIKYRHVKYGTMSCCIFFN